MLVQRLRRWPNIDPTMGEYLFFAGYVTSIFPRDRINRVARAESLCTHFNITSFTLCRNTILMRTLLPMGHEYNIEYILYTICDSSTIRLWLKLEVLGSNPGRVEYLSSWYTHLHLSSCLLLTVRPDRWRWVHSAPNCSKVLGVLCCLW